MDDIVWEDPPENALTSRPGRYRDFAETLRKNPKRWAVLPRSSQGNRDSAKGTAANIRTGKMTAFQPKGSWDTAVGDDARIFVRYTGSTVEAAVDITAEPAVPRPTRRTASSLNTTDVRAWARRNDYEISGAGRLPNSLLREYAAAHGLPDPTQLVDVVVEDAGNGVPDAGNDELDVPVGS